MKRVLALAALGWAGLGGLAGCGGANAPAPPPDAIRVGGPSAPGDTKLAVVGSRRDLAGAPFVVTGAHRRVVLRGRLRAARGSPAPWPAAAVADLTRVRAPGAYRISVGRLRSRPWVVAADPAARLVPVLLGFLAANRDGREPSPLHGPSHLHDATVASGRHKGRRFDLTGGWMDAGDRVKYTPTIAFAAATLQAAARVDRRRARMLNAEADVGIRWLRRAHPAPDLFVAQVGDERDHEERTFRNPAGDDASGRPGIAVRLAYPGRGADIAGKVAAALAPAAARAHGRERAQLLAEARAWYEVGRASAAPNPKLPIDAYPDDTWRDDMAAGAAALYRATGERRYLADARLDLAASRGGGTLGWSSLAGLAAADLCGALGRPPVHDRATRTAACGLLAELGADAASQAGTTAFGTPGAPTWGQTAMNAGAGAAAALAERAGVLPGGLAVAAGARDYLLGRNPWDSSFVTGVGPRAPRHPHHWNGRGPLRGAVVGGPAPLRVVREQVGTPRRTAYDTDDAFYEDRRADYVTSEPAIDQSALTILLVAALARDG